MDGCSSATWNPDYLLQMNDTVQLEKVDHRFCSEIQGGLCKKGGYIGSDSQASNRDGRSCAVSMQTCKTMGDMEKMSRKYSCLFLG